MNLTVGYWRIAFANKQSVGSARADTEATPREHIGTFARIIINMERCVLFFFNS